MLIRVMAMMVPISPLIGGFGPSIGMMLGLCLIGLIGLLFFPNVSLHFCYLDSKGRITFLIGDFWPIFLLVCLYKLLSKVFVGRLLGVIDKFISPNHSVFLKGRFLVNGMVVVNELLDLAKNSKKSCLIFKVNFEKAYDSVSCSYHTAKNT